MTGWQVIIDSNFRNTITFFQFLKKGEISLSRSLTIFPLPSTNAVFTLDYYVVWAGDYIFINFVVSRFPNFMVSDCNYKIRFF